MNKGIRYRTLCSRQVCYPWQNKPKEFSDKQASTSQGTGWVTLNLYFVFFRQPAEPLKAKLLFSRKQRIFCLQCIVKFQDVCPNFEMMLHFSNAWWYIEFNMSYFVYFSFSLFTFCFLYFHFLAYVWYFVFCSVCCTLYILY